MTFPSFLSYIIFIISSLRYVIGTFFVQANSRWNPLRRVVGWSAGTGGQYESSRFMKTVYGGRTGVRWKDWQRCASNGDWRQ